ncbi:hypothetical protein Tco_0096869 [Tanacetum coccineum]
MSEPMPTIPTQSPFTYPIPNSSASPSFTQDDTFMPNPSASPSFTQDDTFMPEPIQPMPTFTQTAFSQPAVHTQHTHPAQNNPMTNGYEDGVLDTECLIIIFGGLFSKEQPKEVGAKVQKDNNNIFILLFSLMNMVGCYKRENKVRTLLLQALPEDHMPDFHHYDDARDIWMAVKARFGGNEESKKMKKTMLKQQFAEFSTMEQDSDTIYETFDQADQWRMEEMGLKVGKWLMLSLGLQECNVKTVMIRSCLAENTTGAVEKVQIVPLGCDYKINDLNNMFNNLDRLYNDFCQGGENAFTVPSYLSLETYYAQPIQSDIEGNTDSETHASCASSLKTQTKDIPPPVDIQTLPESDLEDPNSTTGSLKFRQSIVPAGRSDSAASRNRPAVHSAGAPNHAGWSKRPATVSAGRSVSAGCLNPAARPYFRPSSVFLILRLTYMTLCLWIRDDGCTAVKTLRRLLLEE